MLGVPYTNEIDIWSFGCVLAELFSGFPIFPGKDENEQMSMIVELNGMPSKNLLNEGVRASIFFDENADFLPNPTTEFKGPNSKTIGELIGSKHDSFNDFLRVIIKRNVWNSIHINELLLLKL